jgi:predicted dehydrogenase
MQYPSPGTKVSRRQFLGLTGAALAFPTIIPISALGRADRPAASGRITLGAVGCGGMGKGNTESFLGLKDCQVVAACDVDQQHLQALVRKVNGHYKDTGCKGYQDYRELMARGDIDAVMLAVPDHWHALAAVEAARQKKDIYGEKPLARTIAEQQAIVHAVQANRRIWQTCSWQRSQANFHKAAEIVRNGLIGKITRVEVGLPDGQGGKVAPEDMVPSAPPAELDYETWIGPSKMMPYIRGRVHQNWRWNYNTGGGQLLDWVGHHCDIAHWGCGFDNSGPLEVEGKGEFPPMDAVWNTCTKYRIELKYPGDVMMTMAGGYPDIRGGTKWIGTDGWVWVDRGAFEASNAGMARLQAPAGRAAQGEAPHFKQSPPQFPGLGQVAEADYHPGRDGPPLGYPGPFGPDLNARRPEAEVGRAGGADRRGCGRQQAAQPALPPAVADRWIRGLISWQVKQVTSVTWLQRPAGRVAHVTM